LTFEQYPTESPVTREIALADMPPSFGATSRLNNS
jgi:hypothetical protein